MVEGPRYSRAYYPELADKMEARVAIDTITGCWNWTRGVNADGYGHGIYHEGKQVRPHRMAFLISHGYLPAPGLLIRHLCSNPRCCCPDHLAEGTAWENAQDTKAAGRCNPSRKSFRQRKADALAIRAAEGGHTSIAKRFGVSISTVSRVRRGGAWGFGPVAKERRRTTKLTESDVRAIRKSGESNKELAARFGVTAPNIHAIRQRKTWRRVA